MAEAYDSVIAGMGQDVYERLLLALETGRWPDGRQITSEQREHAMQAVIAWGQQHLPPEQRVGYIDKGHKAAPEAPDDPQPLSWQDS